eukprot:7332547-Ditylum_brightwellii.AAC.1
MGQLHKVMTKPVRLLAQSGSLGASLAHSPAKSASTKQSISKPSTAEPITSPLPRVSLRYLLIRFSAALCDALGLLKKRAHCKTAY